MTSDVRVATLHCWYKFTVFIVSESFGINYEGDGVSMEAVADEILPRKMLSITLLVFTFIIKILARKPLYTYIDTTYIHTTADEANENQVPAVYF